MPDATARRSATLLAVAAVTMLAGASTAAASLRAPRLQSPSDRGSVQSVPYFSWTSVRRAAQYQFEFSADSKFSSAVNGFAQGPISINGTAITDDKAIPNGKYYWRVRAVTSADHAGRWSTVRTLTKAWTATPTLQSPTGGATIDWPTNPLVLQWSSVPYAVTYNVYIATDPALANLVLGSVSSPFQVQGPQYAFPTVLAPGTYYWAIQPVDAEGDRGTRSQIGTFTWTWPSVTSVSEVDDSADPSVVEPQFNWNAIAGAASYEVEISRAQDFASGSDVIDQTGIAGNSFSPTAILPNETNLYWRMRARDASGDAGDWNVGTPFQESFDQASASTIQNLQVVDQSGNPIAPTTQTSDPIVTWNAIPGASSYTVTVGGWQSGTGCNFAGSKTTTVANAAFTLIGRNQPSTSQLPSTWPGPNGGILVDANPGDVVPLCLRIAAQRDDSQLGGGGLVVSSNTQVGSTSAPAITYQVPPTNNTPLTETAVADANPYQSPVNGTTVTHTPIFKWSPVAGANGYFVVISYDRNFTNIVPGGIIWTRGSSWAPPGSLLDETNAYWWEILPADSTGTVRAQPQNAADNAPQFFNKSSVPPTPNSPTDGSTVQTQPTFSWSSAIGARNYTLQIAGDTSFANPIEQITTDATSFTATKTLPADKVLYWRVRANDLNNQGLNWSPVSTFTHHLPVPTPSASNPTGGTGIPLLSWSSVSGATSYNMFVQQADGSTKSFSFDAPDMTPTTFFGTGIWHWQIQSVFPGGATSAYSSPLSSFVRTIPAPGGVHATKSGTRIEIQWSPNSVAKQYQVQLSTTDGFASPVASDTTDNTVWAPQIDAVTAGHKLFWRLALVDQGGNVGAYAYGVFHAPRHHRKAASCKRTKRHHRCVKKKRR